MQISEPLADGPDWMSAHRKKAVENLKSSPLPPFRYGLSIFIKPEADLRGMGEGKGKIHCAFSGNARQFLKSSPPEEFVSGQWLTEEDGHALYELHQAQSAHVLFLCFPRNAHVPEPIEIDCTAVYINFRETERKRLQLRNSFWILGIYIFIVI